MLALLLCRGRPRRRGPVLGFRKDLGPACGLPLDVVGSALGTAPFLSSLEGAEAKSSESASVVSRRRFLLRRLLIETE